jgi:hypothetical protein
VALAVAEFQRLLTGISNELGTRIDKIGPRLGRLSQPELLGFISDAYPALATPYLASAASATAVWYGEQPSKNAGFVVEPAELAPVEQLAASGRWAMLQADPASALKGTASRAVFGASRDTVLINAGREGARWARHASASACGFCRMLATRDEQYLYKASGVVFDKELGAYRTKVIGRGGRTQGTQKLGDRYHDHCHCTAVPVRKGGTFEPAPYVKQWEADYKAATRAGASSAKEIALAMERASGERAVVAGERAVERRDTAVWLDAEDDYLHALEYWQRVDAEDLHSVPTAVAAEPAQAVGETPMNRAARELREAIDAGDDDRVEAAVAALEALEDAERRAAERAGRAETRKAAKAEADADRIIALIEEGADPAEAESEVTGKSVSSIRRRDFIAQSRAEGHRGEGFDQLLASVFHRRVGEMALEAENATNGYMVRKPFELKVNPKELWSVNDATARKWMTPEMAEWFDKNGRLTRPILREMVLRGEYSINKFAAQNQDYLQ